MRPFLSCRGDLVIDLKRKKDISRTRVTQILNLLGLDTEVQEMVVKLGDPTPSGGVTERRLRKIVELSGRGQRGWVRRRFRTHVQAPCAPKNKG